MCHNNGVTLHHKCTKCLPNTLYAKLRVLTVPFVSTCDKEQAEIFITLTLRISRLNYFIAQVFRFSLVPRLQGIHHFL